MELNIAEAVKMTYNQMVKKYGSESVNKAYDIWKSNGSVRIAGIIAVKGCAGKLHKCIEMIIKGELK